MLNRGQKQSAGSGGQTRRTLRPYAGVTALILVSTVAAVVGPKLFKDSRVRAAGNATPLVTVSQPFPKDIHGRMQFLGQFSAVDRVDLRAQVGGTLTYIGFKDGDVVRSGALLFTIDPTPYQIKFDEGTAQVARARARLELATTELARAQTLRKTDAGTVENVEQRSAELRSAQAALDEAETLVRDAKFDLDHTHVYAPFTGRMGTHLVSVGNLVLGNRGGGSAPTLLATIVSINPIYLNFDMSEADYLNFERERAAKRVALANKVEIALSDESRFARQGILDFLDNTFDRSSGTIHARATVPNSDLLLTPGAFGRVRLNLVPERQVLLVPDAAVSADQTDRMVLTVGSDEVVKAIKVQIGELRYGLRVVYSGLSASQRVIIAGPPVLPGTKVSVKEGTINPGPDEGGI
ncbi:efflux RND transporter periplasmic adaptor subunit [Acidicapsa dinghuensis]|uniref:Efflux RND transporter periplasmic adaptor subunit n=1 Tax=Acidicapsa dinghuensis TaxID=2218256 RepID=A0ABW1EM46_9BACT|nr:efflux RND transporter periplasmic adaptor subunit [Acidicapsa dinghuensis]